MVPAEAFEVVEEDSQMMLAESAQTQLDAAAQWGGAHGAPPRADRGPGPVHALARGGRGAGGGAHAGRDLRAAAQTPRGR